MARFGISFDYLELCQLPLTSILPRATYFQCANSSVGPSSSVCYLRFPWLDIGNMKNIFVPQRGVRQYYNRGHST